MRFLKGSGDNFGNFLKDCNYEQFVNNAQLMNKILVKYNEKRPLPEREVALMYDFVILALLEMKLLFRSEL